MITEIGNIASDSTDLAMFAEEMKYLYDNGFKIRVQDLGYDDKTKDLYIKR
jgi:hypothetical protein